MSNESGERNESEELGEGFVGKVWDIKGLKTRRISGVFGEVELLFFGWSGWTGEGGPAFLFYC